MKFAYADPPYYGYGKKLYGEEHPEAHKWDDKETHFELIKKLCDEFPDGWALSMNMADLQWQLPAMPEDVRVGVYAKTWHQIRPTLTQWAWEPVVWRTEKKGKRTPMVRDWMACPVARQTGTIGAKPEQFNLWVLDLLGYVPEEDELHDLFPGSKSMEKATKVQRLF